MGVDEEKVKVIIDIINAYNGKVEKQVLNLINLIEPFKKTKEEEQKKLPYALNLLDEIGVNENGHSRIFAKILLYTEDNISYPILERFISKFFSDQEINTYKFKNVEIQNERHRIDILITMDKFAVIIENKINGAGDQDNQINRYIEKIESTGGVSFENIYVLYLTNSGWEPEENSFSKENRSKLGKRYKSINYKDDIYLFLKEEVKTFLQENNNISKKYLIETVIVQYIDYLEGQFFKREGEEKMNKALKNVIEKEFKFNEIQDNLAKLKEVEEYLDTLKDVNILLEEKKGDLIEAIGKTPTNIETIFSKYNIELKSLEYLNVDGRAGYEIEFNNSKYGISAFFGLYYDIDDHDISFKEVGPEIAFFLDSSPDFADEIDEDDKLRQSSKKLIDKGFEFNIKKELTSNRWRLIAYRKDISKFDSISSKKLEKFLDEILKLLLTDKYILSLIKG